MTDNPWIEWNGGECPVEPDTIVKIRVRSGYETIAMRAGLKHLQKFWRHERSKAAGDGDYDIIAYQVQP